MTHESPALGRASADAHDVAGNSTPVERHGGRFANVTVEGMRRLTVRRLRLFDMGFAAGRYFDAYGSFRRLNGLPVGSVVDSARLPDVLELAGVSEKTWENNVSSWVPLRMAHRCKPRTVALFVSPLDGAEAICPRCHRALERASSLPNRGSDSPALREESSRLAGESEHESPVASNAERTVVGTVAVESQVPEVPSQKGSSEIDALAREDPALELIANERARDHSDHEIAALLNVDPAAFLPPIGFERWTGHAVRVFMGEASHAA
jgi:hypothetical protein